MDTLEQLFALRADALSERDPTVSDDVLAVLLREAGRFPKAHILEVGTGRGLTAVAFLLAGAAHVTTFTLANASSTARQSSAFDDTSLCVCK